MLHVRKDEPAALATLYLGWHSQDTKLPRMQEDPYSDLLYGAQPPTALDRQTLLHTGISVAPSPLSCHLGVPPSSTGRGGTLWDGRLPLLPLRLSPVAHRRQGYCWQGVSRSQWVPGESGDQMREGPSGV